MAGASSERRARPRPLSPHLQIYRPQINMVMSILHRITGAALYVGTVLLAGWLLAAATSPEYFAYRQRAVRHLAGHDRARRLLLGADPSRAGRHAPLHLGHGRRRSTSPAVDLLSWGTIVLSVLLTAALWFYIGIERGWVTAWQ